MPISDAWCGLVIETGLPSKNTSPASTARLPVRALTIVDFPAPLSPMSATTSPASMSKDALSSARTCPKLRDSPRASSSGAIWVHLFWDADRGRGGAEARPGRRPTGVGVVWYWSDLILGARPADGRSEEH